MTRFSRQTSDHSARLSWLGAQPRAPQLPSVVGSGAGHDTCHPVASGRYYSAAGYVRRPLGRDAKDFAKNDAESPSVSSFQELLSAGSSPHELEALLPVIRLLEIVR